MTDASILNRRRALAILVSRSFKAVLMPDTSRPRWHIWLARILWPFGWRERLWRAAFSGAPEALGLEANHVLADLRNFCLAQDTGFDPNPIIMARRAGRREVWLRIQRYLGLNEAEVNKLMELDYE